MRSAPIRDARTLGLVLREARLQQGLSQQEVAARIDVHQSYIAELEAGKSVKAIERLLDYARATGARLHLDLPDA